MNQTIATSLEKRLNALSDLYTIQTERLIRGWWTSLRLFTRPLTFFYENLPIPLATAAYAAVGVFGLWSAVVLESKCPVDPWRDNALLNALGFGPLLDLTAPFRVGVCVDRLTVSYAYLALGVLSLIIASQVKGM